MILADNRRAHLLLLLTLAALPALSGCMSGTNLNTAKTLDWGQIELGAGARADVLNGHGYLGPIVDARIGLARWADIGAKAEFIGWGPILFLVDAKFLVVDEERLGVSFALQPSYGMSAVDTDYMLSALVSRRFERFEPVCAYRLHWVYFDAGADTSKDDEDDDWKPDLPDNGMFVSDLFVGARIRVLDWLYLFPEVGASLYHCGDDRPTYHANLGVQFQFDLRKHYREQRQ